MRFERGEIAAESSPAGWVRVEQDRTLSILLSPNELRWPRVAEGTCER